MCYVIPIVHAMLLRQDMKKARLPTQAPLWVNRRTMFYSQILCEKAQKAPCFWNFLSLIVFSPIITAASTKKIVSEYPLSLAAFCSIFF